MHKNKDGGIACQKWPSSVWPVPRPDHPAVDRASPAEQLDCYSEPPFSGSPNPPGGPPNPPGGPLDTGEQSGPTGLTTGASGAEAGAAELIAGLLLGQPPTARFLPTYKYPFFQLG
jgi:hypothetical protein